jgi:hypothetical protein
VPIWIVGSAAAAGAGAGVGLSDTQAELFLISKLLVVVLKIIKPVAGLAMASRCAVVIRGGKKPLVVLFRSNTADPAGVVVPIPTFWAILVIVMAKQNKIANSFFMTVCLFFKKNEILFFIWKILFPMDANVRRLAKFAGPLKL